MKIFAPFLLSIHSTLNHINQNMKKLREDKFFLELCLRED